MKRLSQPLEIESAQRHEDVFLARYSRLRAWALQLTGNDRELSEDLVQDAFVHFTLARPDLSQVQNLDGYLYSMLRNLNVSHLRRSQRLRARALSVVEYDSAGLGLQATDPRDLVRVQDELRACCQYACTRKDSSRMGSVMILRFLHGYYPREVALIMKCSREAVEERLRVARNEARQYLKDPGSLRFMRESRWQRHAADVHGRDARATSEGSRLAPDEFLCDLRNMVFQTRTGQCPGDASLADIYSAKKGSTPDCALLAHVVSCLRCLEEVNALLGLASLNERYPTDTVDKDAGSRSDDDDRGTGGYGTGSGSGGEEFLARCKARALEITEHRPRELSISVNGRVMAGQRIGGTVNEQTLSLHEGEQINFVEVISEQEVCLLFLDLTDQPVDCAIRKPAQVELTDGRTLEATITLNDQVPVVQVTYFDPLGGYEVSRQSGFVQSPVPLHQVPPAEQPIAAGRPGSWTRTAHAFKHWCEKVLRGAGFWLRPASVTALVGLILIAALIFTHVHVTPVSAAELLNRSAAHEQAVAGNLALVLHRTVSYEEKQLPGGTVLSRRRIELWQSAAHGVKLRRVYDEGNNLLVGAWSKADGTTVIYRPGIAPQSQATENSGARNAISNGQLWLLDVSAKDFSALVEKPEAVTLEETADSYTLRFSRESAESGLLSADLKLNKADLHATEQALVVNNHGDIREYSFVEGDYRQLPNNQVAPNVFDPDPVFTLPVTRRTEVDKNTHNIPPVVAPALAGGPVVASAELEVEVTFLLNQIKADLGEQVSLQKTAGGKLQLEAIVESETRKGEVLRALRPVSDNPAVIIDVSTVAEASSRRGQGSGVRHLTQEVEVQAGRIPADDSLRRYFAARLGGVQDDARVDDAIRQLATNAMNHSRQALLHASALKKLATRFSATEIRALTPEARRKWILMMAEHARAHQRNVAALRQELAEIFAGNVSAAGVTADLVTEATLPQNAERLLQLSHGFDQAVHSAFTLSTGGGSAVRIKSAEFWNSLRSAEGLAAAIQSIARD